MADPKIEDLLEDLEERACLRFDHNTPLTPYDEKFVEDVAWRTRQGNRLSVKQAELACKILNKHLDFLTKHTRHERDTIAYVLENPKYRQELYQSQNIPREVRYIGGRKLAFRTKMNPNFRDRIKALRAGSTDEKAAHWHRPTKLWIAEVNKHNIDDVMSIISHFNFGFDDEVAQFLTDCKNAEGAQNKILDTEDGIQLRFYNDNVAASFWEDIALEEQIKNV